MSAGIKASAALHPAERKQQLDAARAKRRFGPETREKIRQARLRQHFPTKMTSIEAALFAEFKKRRLRFAMHVSMFGRWQPDFVFESARLVVQADGDYWHSRPASKDRDAAFDATAVADGWTVWRFSGTQITTDPISCARAVARFVHSAASIASTPPVKIEGV